MKLKVKNRNKEKSKLDKLSSKTMEAAKAKSKAVEKTTKAKYKLK